MTFRDAIKAHAQWKLRLELYVSGNSTEELDPARVQRDDVCELGQWIHSSKDFYDDPEFLELKKVHAKFHRVVGDIIKAAQRGRAGPALLASESEYSNLSLHIITLLKEMQRRLGVE